MLHGRGLVRRRVRERGAGSVFNLTGVTRAFPLTAGDLDRLDSQLAFYSHFDGTAEAVGVGYAGGDVAVHDACFPTRVSAGILATMLALADAGDAVFSVVPAGHSHPSIRTAARIAGARFDEVHGVAAALERLAGQAPRFLVISPITPQKFHLDESELRELVAAGQSAGSLVVVDDEHGAVRIAHYEQSPILALGGVDVALFSLDKHLQGPRTALLVGKRPIVETIRSQMYLLGLEAPFANYVAGLRALEGFRPDEIREAGALARELMPRVAEVLRTDAVYPAGPGVALAADDLMTIVVRGASAATELVPMEVSSLVAMRLAETSGFVTILAIGMPGASPPLRLMMYPDGVRAGVEAIASAVGEAVSFAAGKIGDVEAARAYLCAPPADD